MAAARLKACDIGVEGWEILAIDVRRGRVSGFLIDAIERISLHVIIDVIRITHFNIILY